MDTILNLCRRYARNEITRSDLLDQLAAYPYAPADHSLHLLDDTVTQPAGTIHDVLAAARYGLIDDSIYDELLDRLT